MVGPVDPEHVIDLVVANQATKTFPASDSILRGVDWDLDKHSVIAHRELALPVVRPKVMVALKAKLKSSMMKPA